jgi:nitrite reductase (NADH) large subunit
MKHVIVGNGVAGVTAAQTIKRTAPDAEVHIFGAEPYPYYRRPLLWEFIAGKIEQYALYFRPPEWYGENGIELHLATEVVSLDASAHHIGLADESLEEYDRLLLTTGARPFIPPCEGTEKDGVFALRTLDDALAIKAYAHEADTAIVVGGGLLGLETARALLSTGLAVTVVEFFPYLLPQQLDEEGSEVLKVLLQAQGLKVVTGATTKAVLGVPCADCIQIQNGIKITGDLVIFSTGIRSEVGLAQAAGLDVNRGIIVDDRLNTSAQDVFAAGDAAEFEGRVYGIIPPAIEQARVAAANMVEAQSATYTGSIPSTTLKVVGAELTTLGDAVVEGDEYTQLRHADVETGLYRKAVLRDGHIVGAILLNDKERTQPMRHLIAQNADVSAFADHILDDDFDVGSIVD